MLDTRQRTLLLESLRPPVGYRLDQAVGTSYTLDLMALLTAPLAFTFFNYHDEEGEPSADPVALLEALRRHSENITLFCQAGNISVPKPEQTLLAYLEGSVVAVQAPKKGGIFHPKVWVLRFVAHKQPVRYRMLCLTRNLTFDRAWDTSLVLEGELTGRTYGFGKNRPLSDFLEALPALAVRPVSPRVRERMDQLASEVRRVRFETPAPFQDFRFLPMGLGRSRELPFPSDGRLLVMAPFLSASILEELGRKREIVAVISRPEALAPMPEELLPEDNTFVLAAAAELDARDTAEDGDPQPGAAATPSPAELHGLHAKLFVADKGRRAHLFTGSANATAAAFQSNVEFLVELVGGRWKCGISALLGAEEDRQQDTLRSLLQPYEPPVDEPDPVDEIQQALERRVQQFAREIASRSLTARARSGGEEGTWDLDLSGRLPPVPRQTTLSAWPTTLPATTRQDIHGAARPIAAFKGVTFEAITAFWAFEIEARQEGKAAQHRFVMPAKLVGAPADRRQRLLRSLLKNRRQVLRLLLLLLSDEALDVSQLVDGGEVGESWTGRFAGWDEPALLEALLLSLSRSPDRVDQAERLIEDLRRTPEGRELLPVGLEAIWEPVRAARKKRRA